jgi:N-acetylglucosamine malate deacetylase 2
MAEPRALLAVFAHPDDETFRCGGTLALLASRGVRSCVLTATRGEGGSCGDPPLCAPEELGEIRERELSCACHALGLEPPLLLDYRDGRLAEADPEGLIGKIVRVVREIRPQVILTFGPDGLSGHPDHVTIGRLATEAFLRAGEPPAHAGRWVRGTTLQIPSALYHVAVAQSLADQLGLRQVRAVPDEDITMWVDVSPVWDQKMEAIRCHASQHQATPILKAPLERQQLFLGTETFRLAASREPLQHDPLALALGDAVIRKR